MNPLHHAARSLVKSPGFTAIALVTLALGIGVNTAMFSVVDTLLFKAAPYHDPTKLVRVFRTSPQSRHWPHSAPEITDLRAQATSFEQFAPFSWASFSFAEPGQPAERIRGLNVGEGFFATLGTQPALGRVFAAGEYTEGRSQVIVLSEGLWRRRFGADPSVVGRTLRVDGQNVTVIGVMPAGVEYPLLWGVVDAWRPLVLSADDAKDRGRHWLNAIARLRPDRTMKQAQAECDTITARWVKDFPDVSTGTGLRLVVLHESTMDQVGRSLSALVMGLAGFVLLIACANLANLQLARTSSRARDFAIRSALGASRWQLMRELLTESVLLAVVGGGIGLLLATWIVDALGRRIVIAENPGMAIGLDLPVLLFALAASLATGVAFGLLPAWTASRTDVNATLKQQARGSTGDRSQHRLRQALIVGEVALALALLTGAGFFVRGLSQVLHRDPGWNRAGVLSATVNLPGTSYRNDDERRAFYARALARLQALPGVEHAALASSLPITGYNTSRDLVPAGQPLPPRERTPLAYKVSVTPDFFRVLQIQLLQGRLFPDDVRPDGPQLAVVNESLARQFWPGQNPIGQRIGGADPNDHESYEVIGVVRDVAYPGNLGTPETRLQFYRPLVQDPWNYLTVALRITGPAAAIGDAVRRTIAEIDPDLPAYSVRTIDEMIDRIAANFRVTNQLLLGFAALGLLLSVVGLYGVIAGLVVQRTPEFGIRLALGAQARDVLWLVLGKGLRLAGWGVAMGLIASLGLSRVFAAVVPSMPGLEPAVLAGIASLLLAVALLACWAPARRATKVDPMIALRAE